MGWTSNPLVQFTNFVLFCFSLGTRVSFVGEPTNNFLDLKKVLILLKAVTDILHYTKRFLNRQEESALHCVNYDNF